MKPISLFFVWISLFISQAIYTSGKSKANIIYLMLDEWGYFESGHMGSTDLITPNIDQFASEGMRFTNAYAGAPVCGPTRCSLLTGLHAGNMSMRVNNGHSPIRADEPTLGSMLKTRGYATGGFGKWGIGGRVHQFPTFRIHPWHILLFSAYFPRSVHLPEWESARY